MIGLLWTAMLLQASAPSASRDGMVPPQIDSVPASSSETRVSARCPGGQEVVVRVAATAGRVQVLELSGYGRTLPPDLLDRWNGWLRSFQGLRSVQMDCTGGGAVIYLEPAPMRNTRLPGALVVGWVPGGLYRMSPADSQ